MVSFLVLATSDFIHMTYKNICLILTPMVFNVVLVSPAVRRLVQLGPEFDLEVEVVSQLIIRGGKDGVRIELISIRCLLRREYV